MTLMDSECPGRVLKVAVEVMTYLPLLKIYRLAASHPAVAQAVAVFDGIPHVDCMKYEAPLSSEYLRRQRH